MTDTHIVTELIAEIVENYPQSIALDYGCRQLRYDELDRRADRFTAYLVQVGVVAGDTVAICMERSFDWIVAALGIMRIGAAYVPLDFAWPDSRLSFAVEDSGATVLVARAKLLDRLQVKARGIDPCRDAEVIAAAPGVAKMKIDPESLAYVIYTSGSTGVPKGVEITHANLAHLVRWHNNAFRVTGRDRASHLAGLGFDAAVWEVWPSLCAGSTVCLADDAVRSSAELIQQWMIGERVTIGFVPTVHAMPMMAMDWPESTPLRVLLTGGDALHHGPRKPQPFDVFNNYGPTECTVVATTAHITPGADGAPPIGRPITGASVYLLNEDGTQVSDGNVGEICIGGGGVGRGYRNLPDSTERSFLPDPFAGRPRARMYRTGDRGVRRPDGEIEFRGRADRQTKIRGQRVELDEISSILTDHPNVEFATVIANKSEGGEKWLVAYVLPKARAGELTSDGLQKHLQRSLPDYMIPAVFVRLRAVPISPNGKLDLTLLERPTEANLLTSIVKGLPVPPIQEKLLAMVRELLENNAVSASDNFFLAGGHSLLGMQLVIRLRDAFDVSLTMQQLFEAPTVERVALLIESVQHEVRLALLKETRHKQERLALIWCEMLGRKHVGLDSDFFNLGGHAALVATLQKRIAAEFGQTIPISQLFRNSTVRQQMELTRGVLRSEPLLPSGVLPLQPHGSRPSIFWVHYVNANLAKEFGESQPLFFVILTAADLASLGVKPTLQCIAACLVGKILAAQPEGPYNIGGLCVGSVLAYEVASQLRTAGHKVSLLVLLDAPSSSYLRWHDSLLAKLISLRFLLARNSRLGLRQSFFNFRQRLIRHFSLWKNTKSAWTEISGAHRLVESAAFAYHPEKYQGNVLLLLASERNPPFDFLPGWQALVSGNLQVQYVKGHHRELLTPQNVGGIAETIFSHLITATDQVPLTRSA